MPAQDGTGPRGEGPMTGRGFGPCAGFGIRRGFDRGSVEALRGGFRRGLGRGFGRTLVFEPLELTKDQEKKILEAELADLEAEKKELEEALKKFK